MQQKSDRVETYNHAQNSDIIFEISTKERNYAFT